MTIRSTMAVLATALALAWSDPVSAQQAKCIAGKTKCMAKKGTGLLKCHQLSETPGKSTDPNAGGCLDKAMGKFDGGIDPTKGCFEKLENKSENDCLTNNDTAAAEGAVDSCVGAFVAAIDPPPLERTKCGAGKTKCVSKLLKGLMKCRQLAQTPLKPTDPNTNGCVDKALAKFNGGIDPTKGCFEKLENKNPNDCLIFDDTGTLQGLVEGCVQDLADLVTATTSSTTTTVTTTSSTTTTCPVFTEEILGALPPTAGRFNYNLNVGLPGANAACAANFACTHACTYAELLTAESAGELVGLQDINSNPVTTFWAIDSSRPPLAQCQDDVTSFLNWEYGTAHTASRGDFVNLNNGTGDLGTLQTGQQCNFTTKSVGCCQ